MLERFRNRWARILAPVARFFMRIGLSPDAVTVIGTMGVSITALVCFPLGWLWPGTVVITVFVLLDMVDGQMAKGSGTASAWGAFLDSSMDRIADGALFAGVVLYFAAHSDSLLWPGVTLGALILGQVTSYVKARAESHGYACSGGLAARADRVLLLLLGTLLEGLGVPYALPVAVSALALASAITVGQRFVQVYRQAHAGHAEIA